MSEEESNLIKLLISLRDANTMAVKAINAYLEAEAPPEVRVEKVEELFPDDLRAMLTFEAQPDATIIRPKQFLGKDNFAKIVAIVKKHGGSYISEGKNSRFQIPKGR